ncbi:MAG: hypothetical protein J6334_02270 [Kiritimatiellae bacterium]|nr:hypothetical protein [Kiritimatiellia bacterium]
MNAILPTIVLTAMAAFGAAPENLCTNLIPQLDFIYPAGGKQGEEIDVVVGGRNLSAITSAHLSGEGVNAVFLGIEKSVTYNAKGKTITTTLPNRYRFRIVIEPDAPLGARTLRVGSAMRISEPLYFEVADNTRELSEAIGERTQATNRAVTCALPVCLNGCLQEKVPDRYRFELRRGMAIVAFPSDGFTVKRYLPPVLDVTGPDGKPCATLQHHPTARGGDVVTFTAEQDGPHTLSVTRPEAPAGTLQDGWTYRIRVGQYPLIVDFNPKKAKKGSSVNIRLEGINLPQNRIRLFTGGKNEALCKAAIVGDGLVLPDLDFQLTEEGDEQPQPDFRVWMTPTSVSIPSLGSSVPIHLFAERLNGFDGEIQVRLDYPPLSIAFEGGTIPAGKTEGVLTVSTDGARYPKTYFPLELVATATLNGQPTKHPVIPIRREGTDEPPHEALSFPDVGAKVSPSLTPFRLIARLKPLPYSATSNRIPIAKSAISAEWCTVYKPVVLWPEKGVTVKGVPADLSPMGQPAVALTIDPALYPAGSNGELIIGAVVKKTGILVGTSQVFPFTVKK